MTKPLIARWLTVAAFLACTGCLWPEFIVNTDYQPPKPAKDEELADDRLEDKPALPFDPALVDKRPLGEWLVNASAAVVKLDVPPAKPDTESDLLQLHASYAAAVAAARGKHDDEILPSVN